MKNKKYENIHINQISFINNSPVIIDNGKNPFVANIKKVTEENNAYRAAIWTGEYLQTTVMSIDSNQDIGIEMHENLDQMLYIIKGHGNVVMGETRDSIDFTSEIHDGYSVFIPAGMWHNLINTGDKPLKLFSVYSPPSHPHGTIHNTKQDSIEDEHTY